MKALTMQWPSNTALTTTIPHSPQKKRKLTRNMVRTCYRSIILTIDAPICFSLADTDYVLIKAVNSCFLKNYNPCNLLCKCVHFRRLSSFMHMFLTLIWILLHRHMEEHAICLSICRYNTCEFSFLEQGENLNF